MPEYVKRRKISSQSSSQPGKQDEQAPKPSPLINLPTQIFGLIVTHLINLPKVQYDQHRILEFDENLKALRVKTRRDFTSLSATCRVAHARCYEAYKPKTLARVRGSIPAKFEYGEPEGIGGGFGGFLRGFGGFDGGFGGFGGGFEEYDVDGEALDDDTGDKLVGEVRRMTDKLKGTPYSDVRYVGCSQFCKRRHVLSLMHNPPTASWIYSKSRRNLSPR